MAHQGLIKFDEAREPFLNVEIRWLKFYARHAVLYICMHSLKFTFFVIRMLVIINYYYVVVLVINKYY